jgi:hypothetical protein
MDKVQKYTMAVPVVCVVLLVKGKGVQVCVLHMASPVVLQPSSNPILLIGVCGACGHNTQQQHTQVGLGCLGFSSCCRPRCEL